MYLLGNLYDNFILKLVEVFWIVSIFIYVYIAGLFIDMIRRILYKMCT